MTYVFLSFICIVIVYYVFLLMCYLKYVLLYILFHGIFVQQNNEIIVTFSSSFQTSASDLLCWDYSELVLLPKVWLLL